MKISANLAEEVSTGVKIFYLKRDLALASISGDTKEYKQLYKEFAKVSVQNFELMKKVKFPQVTLPVFSLPGLNLIKTSLSYFFSRKTPDEKLLAKMLKKDKIKTKYFSKVA